MKDFKKQFARFEEALVRFFGSVPHIQENGRRTIVSMVPQVSLVLAIILALGLFGAIFFLPAVSSVRSWFSVIIGISMAVLFFLAYNDLRKGQKSGWNKLFYSALIGLFGFLILLQVGGIFLFLLEMYILFEIRPYYVK